MQIVSSRDPRCLIWHTGWTCMSIDMPNILFNDHDYNINSIQMSKWQINEFRHWVITSGLPIAVVDGITESGSINDRQPQPNAPLLQQHLSFFDLNCFLHSQRGPRVFDRMIDVRQEHCVDECWLTDTSFSYGHKHVHTHWLISKVIASNLVPNRGQVYGAGLCCVLNFYWSPRLIN